MRLILILSLVIMHLGISEGFFKVIYIHHLMCTPSLDSLGCKFICTYVDYYLDVYTKDLRF